MLCNFSKVFPKGKTLKGKPTNFPQKIRSGAKIHTMREDVHNRWKPGMQMQLCTGARSKQYECISDPFCECISIQKVEIRYMPNQRTPDVYMDGRRMGAVEIIVLAANDGFDTLDGFFEWFDESKTYKLLHWTDFRYNGNLERLQKMNDKHLEFNKMN